MRTRRIRKGRGFTLVEVLVASVASAVMVLGLIGGASGYFSRDSQERQKILTQQRLRLVTSAMESDIREAGYIYQNPVTAAARISTVNFPAGVNPVLAVLVPNQINGAPDPAGQFVLVVYGTGDIPNVAPFNLVNNLQGKVIYRWYSQAGAFDPRTQLQGNGNLPNALNGTFQLYGGPAADTIPPILTSNIASITLTAPAALFGPLTSTNQSAIGETVTVQAYTGSDWVGKVPVQNAYIQPRNLGLPPAPLPTATVGNGGSIGGCIANPASCD